MLGKLPQLGDSAAVSKIQLESSMECPGSLSPSASLGKLHPHASVSLMFYKRLFTSFLWWIGFQIVGEKIKERNIKELPEVLSLDYCIEGDATELTEEGSIKNAAVRRENGGDF